MNRRGRSKIDALWCVILAVRAFKTGMLCNIIKRSKGEHRARNEPELKYLVIAL